MARSPIVAGAFSLLAAATVSVVSARCEVIVPILSESVSNADAIVVAEATNTQKVCILYCASPHDKPHRIAASEEYIADYWNVLTGLLDGFADRGNRYAVDAIRNELRRYMEKWAAVCRVTEQVKGCEGVGQVSVEFRLIPEATKQAMIPSPEGLLPGHKYLMFLCKAEDGTYVLLSQLSGVGFVEVANDYRDGTLGIDSGGKNISHSLLMQEIRLQVDGKDGARPESESSGRSRSSPRL